MYQLCVQMWNDRNLICPTNGGQHSFYIRVRKGTVDILRTVLWRGVNKPGCRKLDRNQSSEIFKSKHRLLVHGRRYSRCRK